MELVEDFAHFPRPQVNYPSHLPPHIFWLHNDASKMVYYFKTRCGQYTIYMGKDKYENEDLIKCEWNS